MQSNLTCTWFEVAASNNHTIFRDGHGTGKLKKQGNFWLPRKRKECAPEFKTLADYVIRRKNSLRSWRYRVGAIKVLAAEPCSKERELGRGGWNTAWQKTPVFWIVRTPVCEETDWSRAIHTSIMLDEPSHIFPNLGSRWQTEKDVHVKWLWFPL